MKFWRWPGIGLGLMLSIVLFGLLPVNAATEQIALLNRVTPASESLPELTLSPAAKSWITQHPVLKIGVLSQDWPPFAQRSSRNEMQGISADYLIQIAQMLGIKLQVTRFYNDQEAWQALQRQQIDIMPNLSAWQVPQDITLSVPYASVQPIIAVPMAQNQQPGYYLTDRRVAMARGFIPEAVFKRYYPLAKLHVYDNYQDAISAVAFGHADAFFGDAFPVSRNFLNNMRIAQYANMPEINIGFALNKQNTLLLDLVNQAITTLPARFKEEVLQSWLPGRGEMTLNGRRIDLSEEELSWIKNHPQVSVLTLENYAPVSFIDNDGNVRGIGPEVLSLVALRTGLNFRFSSASTVTSMINQVAENKADMLVSLTPSRRRSEVLRFSLGYVRNAFVLVVRKENQQVIRLNDLKGKTLGMIAGNGLEDFIRQRYPEIKLVTANDANHVMALLDDRRVDAVINTLINSEYQILAKYADEFKIVNTVGTNPAYIAFAMSKDQPILQSIIDKVLLSYSTDELDLIANRWRPNNMVVANSFWYQYRTTIIASLSVALALIMISAVWAFYLRRQITLKQQAQEALADQNQKMRQLVDGTPFPMFTRDTQGRLTDCNRHYLDTVGNEKASSLGRNIIEEGALHDPQKAVEVHQMFMDVMANDTPVSADRHYVLNPHSGEPQRLAVFFWVQPFRDAAGKMAGVLGGWMDITERQNMTEALRIAKDQAEEASRAKSTFLSTMSHEIRTPLNAIIGMLDIAIQKGKQGELDMQALEVATESADGLVELIGDILDISRIENGRVDLDPKPGNIVEIARSVVNTFKGLALQKQIELTLRVPQDMPHNVQIDALRIKQVIANLLSNAIKFTDIGSVSLQVSQQVDVRSNFAHITLQVKDSGVGIAPAQQHHLFQPFEQADNRRKGTGLGLYISQSFCQMMQGDITLESVPGVGTTVTASVALPLAAAVSAASAEPPTSPEQLAAMRIMVVDDNAANRLLMHKQLTLLGHQVMEAESGEAGLALFHQHDWDVMITDCNMPGMDGYQLAAAIREAEQRGQNAAIPIIGFTADAMSEARSRCLRAGMNGCLFKPCTLDDVRRALTEVVQTAPPTSVLLDFSMLAGDDKTLKARIVGQLLRSTRYYLEELQQLLSQQNSDDLLTLTTHIMTSAQTVNANFMLHACEAVKKANGLERLTAGYALEKALKRFSVLLEGESTLN
ncbi:transporter substrate-binding domain-containing protein [Pantoea sp. B9002]|uniref:transporter substrate-binding domain-containing protein n=1 Tax=Pantoea sp. B9002 TaxID=2726979 RepID=UPI0015A49C52|nr:transporter substrate-binding domain-containing protein [Pantoea sp. B9002]NWA60458.1 transporter substrate-binding domain-containing protein [Pantoea sp. B9002]